MSETQQQIRIGKSSILYNAALMSEPSLALFSCESLTKQGLVSGYSDGRGQTCFFQHQGKTMVLRHYQRGGLIAKLLHDQYFGISLNQTRAWKEWNLLQVLTQLQLPVPQPVAARVEKHGLFYRADLVTVLLPDAETLAAKLEKQNVTEQLWRQIGVTIAQFHDHDVYHSDLNAKNIMLDTQGQVYLIDFDQCGFRRNGNWKAKNLERLKRSLRKFKNKNASFNFIESDWDQLMQGYKQGRSEA